MKKIILLLMVLLIFTVGIGYSDTIPEVQYLKGLVLEYKYDVSEMGYDYQMVTLELLDGEDKGKTIVVENALSDNLIFNIEVKEGDRVLLHVEPNQEGNLDYFITDFVRDRTLIFLGIAFLMLLVFIGRSKGIKTVISIGLTIVLIYKWLLPAVLAGQSAMMLSILIAVVVTLITILLISGFNSKSASAIVGTISGVFIAGLLALIVAKFAHLTGMSSEEASFLMYIPQGTSFNFNSLLFAGILLGALGAVMDVAMSISSSVYEIHQADPTMSRGKLFASAMNVGRDIMGTMSNTLILAYTGSTIPLLLVFLAYETPLVRLINLDIIATEIARSLAGSIGLILTIPITALVSVVLCKDEKFQN